MMDVNAVSRIAALGAAEATAEKRIVFAVGETFFFNGTSLERMKAKDELVAPTRKTLNLHTLAGLVAYVKSGIDDTDGIIHVENEREVSIIGPLFGYNKQREIIAHVSFNAEDHGFGQEDTLENTLVWLRTRCVPTPDGAALVKCLGNVTDGNTKTVVDDGFTQQVMVKAGASMVGADKVKSPILLAPYRTFTEVAQPVSEFVVRLSSAHPFPDVTIHEADGGAWKLDAIKKIIAYLREQLPERIVIG